jgi:hypothetical protein
VKNWVLGAVLLAACGGDGTPVARPAAEDAGRPLAVALAELEACLDIGVDDLALLLDRLDAIVDAALEPDARRNGIALRPSELPGDPPGTFDVQVGFAGHLLFGRIVVAPYDPAGRGGDRVRDVAQRAEQPVTVTYDLEVAPGEGWLIADLMGKVTIAADDARLIDGRIDVRSNDNECDLVFTLREREPLRVTGAGRDALPDIVGLVDFIAHFGADALEGTIEFTGRDATMIGALNGVELDPVAIALD